MHSPFTPRSKRTHIYIYIYIEDYQFEKHWNYKQRTRDWESLINKLKSGAQNCGSFVAHPELSDLSNKMFDLIMDLEDRQRFFDTIRAPETFIILVRAALGAKDAKVLSTCPKELLATMVLSLTAKMTQAIMTDSSLVVAWARIACYAPDAGKRKFFSLCEVSPPDLRASCQSKLVHLLGDSLFRAVDSAVIREVTDKLSAELQSETGQTIIR